MMKVDYDCTLRLKTFDEDEINKCIHVEHRFVCSICIEIFNSIEKLKIHYVNVHGMMEKSEIVEVPERAPDPPANKSKICTVCNLPFKNAKTLSKHIKHVHNKIKSFSCNVCSKLFSRKAAHDVSSFLLIRKVQMSLSFIFSRFT